MIDLVFAFSHTHCLAICGFLVPANLLATLQTMIFISWPRFRSRIPLMVTVSSFYALAMVFHVFTWFAVGVVMAPTFILLFLACVCLTINGWALAHPASLSRLLWQIWHWLKLLGNHKTITLSLPAAQSSVNTD